MPSRRIITLALIFWATTLSLVLYRDLLPHLGASAPPPITIDVADEASQQLPVRWTIVRKGKTIGSLTTRMLYSDRENAFQFQSKYTNISWEFNGLFNSKAGVRINIPTLQMTTLMTRTGGLLVQDISGELVLERVIPNDRGFRFEEIVRGSAKLQGRVDGDRFISHCDIDSSLMQLHRDLDPVPMTEGQALNPLQPVNRIANLRAGVTWRIHENNPLESAVATMANQLGFSMFQETKLPLIAKVSDSPELLLFGDVEVSCWVIEYRSDVPRAKTWVRASDGKVLRQEAFREGEQLALVREE